MNSRYRKNLEYFKKISVSFYNNLLKGVSKFPISIEKIENSKNFIVSTDSIRCFINSAYDTNNEMDLMFDKVPENVNIIVLFGIGSGIAVDYIIENLKEVDKLIIVEPSLEIMRNFFHNYDIQKLTKKIKLIDMLVNDIEEGVAQYIEEATSNKGSKILSFVTHISYRSLFSEYYNKLTMETMKRIRSTGLSIRTGERNTYVVAANTFRNVISESFSVNDILNIFNGKPVILVSAGPSLNKNMHLLNEAKEKAIIVAVGSSIKILENNNIRPHFRSAFTPHKLELDIFKDLKEMDIPLIYTDMLYYEVVELYKGPKFSMLSHSNDLSKFMYKKADIPEMQVLAELTVANTTFDLLCRAGCSEIILVGQDLAFTGKTNYADGSVNNFNIQGNEEFIMKETDIYGNEVYTKLPFLQIRDVFMGAMMRHKDQKIRYFNATEGGLPIDGMENVTLKEKIDSLAKLESIEDMIDKVVESSNFNTNIEKFKELIFWISDEIVKINEVNEERSEKLKELIKFQETEKNPNKILIEYSDINRFENKLKEIEFYRDVVQFQLNSIYKTIFRAYKYDGADQRKQLEATENILIRSTLELGKYCSVTKAIIEELELEKMSLTAH